MIFASRLKVWVWHPAQAYRPGAAEMFQRDDVAEQILPMLKEVTAEDFRLMGSVLNIRFTQQLEQTLVRTGRRR